MLTAIHPKLPMRDKAATIDYYNGKLGFSVLSDYGDYLILEKDQIELHFFSFPRLDPATNYGQVYIRCSDIDIFYQRLIGEQVPIHPNGSLSDKPWGQREFSLLDPDYNLLSFGQSL